MKTLNYILISFLFLFITGCGGGGTDSVSSSIDNFTGKFIDSEVTGLNYSCSSGKTGITNVAGEFSCQKNDTVTFSLNGIDLGTTKVKTKIFPSDFFDKDLEIQQLANLVSILQNLDSDGNPENGITIDKNKTIQLNPTIEDINGTQTDLETKFENTFGTDFIKVEDALTHLSKSLVVHGSTTVGSEILDSYYKYAWHIENKANEYETSKGIVQGSSANIKKAWDISKGSGAVVAVIDDSFNASHEDLKDNVIATYNAITKTRVALDKDFLNENGYGAHGTAVAGIIGATADNKGVIGVAPDAKLILIAIGADTNTDSQIIDAFDFAMKNGANVVSCSWGTFDVSSAVNAKIKELYDNNITVIFSTGNDNMSLDDANINDESELPWVIGVGASTEANLKKSSSNWGKRVDILAPSGDNVGIVTTDEMGTAGLNSGNEDLVNNNYTFFNGTSASAPIVSGVAALLYSADPTLTPAKIREAMIKTADKIGDVPYNDKGWNDTYAYGKINAYKALAHALNIPINENDIIIDDEENLTNADTDREININYRGTWDVSGSFPSNGATGVDVNVHPSMTGNGDTMSCGDVTSSNVTLQINSGTWSNTGISLGCSASGSTLTFTPATTLNASTQYRMRYTTALTDTKGDQLGATTTRSFTTGAPADTTQPTASGGTPSNGATNVAVNTNITVTFDETMNTSSAQSSFSISPNVAGSYSWSGNIMTFNPTSNLAGGTTYSITVSTGAQDLAGNGLASAYNFSFTTIETTPPTVSSINPTNGSSGFAVADNLTITFSEPMNPSTINNTNITLNDGGAVSGTVTISGGNTIATFNPDVDLSPLSSHTLTVSTGVTDAVGNAMASQFTSTFTTASADVTPPTVSSITPANAATDISIASNITVTFSESMNSATLTNSNITLNCGGAKAGTVTDNGTTATFNPTSNLPYSTSCTLTVSTNVTDAVGNNLASQFTSTFTTEAPDLTPPTVSSTNPTSGATGILVDRANITITFNEAMNSATLTNSNITIDNGITGTVTDNGTTATFTFDSYLAYNTTYTVTVGTGVTDIAGNNLSSAHNFSFTTESPRAFGISTINPSDTATDISSSTSIEITFDQNINASTAIGANIYLEDSVFALVPSSVSVTNNVITLNPSSTLNIAEEYTLTITNGVQDVFGTSLGSNSVTTFTTSASTCTQTANPTICYSVPAANSANVLEDESIKIRFSEIMTAGSINGTNITLKDGSNTLVSGTVSRSSEGHTATFEPDSNLIPLDTYTVYIAGATTGSETGNTFGSQTSFSFIVSSGVDERDATNNYVEQPGSGLTWLDDTSIATKRNWADAKTYCEGLTKGLYSDWRLPSVNELKGLAKTISLNDDLFVNKEEGFFWSSQSYDADTTKAYDVRSESGTVGKYTKTNLDYVRCVRSDLIAETGADSRSGSSVTMNSTGLVWQDDAAVTTNDGNWTNAGTYCTNLTLDGATDWRLPSVSELETIVDLTVSSGPYINALFVNKKENGYWSSSIAYERYGKTYINYIDFAQGKTLVNNSEFDGYNVRCVRNK